MITITLGRRAGIVAASAPVAIGADAELETKTAATHRRCIMDVGIQKASGLCWSDGLDTRRVYPLEAGDSAAGSRSGK
jgi:hypothetical protein